MQAQSLSNLWLTTPPDGQIVPKLGCLSANT